MTTNNAVAVMTPPMLPAPASRLGGFDSVAGLTMVSRMNSAGKEMGTRLVLTNGGKTAGERRAEGKASGLKGKDLTNYVNASLQGDDATAAKIRYSATLEIAYSKGFVPVEVDQNKAGDKLNVKFVQPKAAKAGEKASGKLKTAEKAAAAALADAKLAEGKVSKLRASLRESGKTDAEIDALLA